MSTGEADVTDGRRRRRVTDEQILDAAVAEFAARGHAGASMAAVAARAGTTKPTLYANFGSKDGLYVAAVAAETERLRAALLSTYAGTEGDPVRAQLHAGTLAIFGYAAARPDGFELLFGAAPGLPTGSPVTRDAYEDVVAAIAGMVRGRLADGDDGDPRHARFVAAMLVGLLHAAARTAVTDGLDHEAAAAVAQSLVLDGLSGLDASPLGDPVLRRRGRAR
ncbi:hypothetical protein DSM112329_01166 [Paraconexibacter sp. AEG42_29]|uniref:HTH tetR-type domain-containing protein n=1 Tax=Paraconexibacter sp. AEG42_29 TaxID=2997339 RepID=A0AAU7ARW1_9ACTN